MFAYLAKRDLFSSVTTIESGTAQTTPINGYSDWLKNYSRALIG